MFGKNYLTSLLTILVFLLAGTAVMAQNGPVRGEVKLQKADGTTVPVADAIVEAFRTDIDRGKLPDAKTNKRGEFGFVGLPLGQRYVLSVSGPGIRPQIQPDVKAYMENVIIIVSEGDGRRPTEAEVRQAAKTVSSTPGGLTEEQKKQLAENEKKVAEVANSNQKAEGSNKVINAAVKAGADAFNAQNYDLAIVEYDKGIDAAPDFIGSAPIFLGNKGLAYQKRSVLAYNAALKGDAAARAAALEKNRADFNNAFAAFDKGLEILKNGAASADANEQKSLPMRRLNLLTYAVETHGLAAKIAKDPARISAANSILEQYVIAETDKAKLATALLNYANNMNEAAEYKNAAAAFRKILETSPDNLDAIAGLGLALYTDGSISEPPDKVVLQEGLNYLQRFADAAPDTHRLKADIKATIEELKNVQKLAPQKVTPPRRKG